MAIIVKTTDKIKLLASIRKAIDEKSITTWSYDKDGDFTHTPTQWINKAWLRPSMLYPDELRFGILRSKTILLFEEIYAVYHGRFIEMLLAHFDNKFTFSYASAHKCSPDVSEKSK